MSCLGFLSTLFGRGEKINGTTYSVIRTIGEGGFSYVDLVTRNGGKYALKRILLQLPEQVEAAKSEIATHKKISHPNVVELVDSEIRNIRSRESGQGIALLLFPYYRNGTLQDLIQHASQSNKPLEEKLILQMFLGVCKGLKALHGCKPVGIAHRDVKPGNLLISDDKKELVLMDLGSATQAECVISNRSEALRLQEHCTQTCTAHYRAPELFEVPSSCTITGKTDVWSLGCSLYCAAFGQSPCDGTALSAINVRVSFPKNHSYSEDFCQLLLWILVPDPDSRPSIDDVHERIISLLDYLSSD